MRTTLVALAIAMLCFAGFASAMADPGKTIVFTSPPWKPYIYQDENGAVQGVYIDILKAIFEEGLQLPIAYVDYPWKRAQKAVKDGQADLIITIATPDRLQYAVKSELPVLELYLHVYTYRDHPRLAEISTIRSGDDILEMRLKPVTNLGNVWHKNNIDHLGVETHYVHSEENAFLFLAAKRADITIEPLIAGNYLIKQLDLAERIIPTTARFGPLKFYLLLSKKSPFLQRMKEIDQAIDTLHQSGRMQHIYESYQQIR